MRRDFTRFEAGVIVGDADDRSVEFANFQALSESFGQPGGWANGDFDGSSNVAFADFLLPSNHCGAFGRG